MTELDKGEQKLVDHLFISYASEDSELAVTLFE